jgi:hypothetical protein
MVDSISASRLEEEMPVKAAPDKGVICCYCKQAGRPDFGNVLKALNLAVVVLHTFILIIPKHLHNASYLSTLS